MTRDNHSTREQADNAGETPAGITATASQNWRPFWMSAAGLLIGMALLTVFLEHFVAHRLPPMTEATLDAAEKRWKETKPASYVLDLEIGGAEPGPVHVEVRDGEVVAMQRNGITPDQRRVWDVWTVSGQFETLEREMQLAADPVQQMDASPGTRLSLQCEFEPHYGYPMQYHRLVYGGGPEVYWRTVRFEPK
jgi:Family of unknown function (DUF6174)